MAIKRMMARRKATDIDEHRDVVGDQLRGLWAALWPKVEAGDTAAVGAAVRVLEATVRLFGLDAAQRHLVVGASITEEEFQKAARELLSVTGPGPLYEMAGIAPPAEPVADVDDDPTWSNLVGPEPLDAAPEPTHAYPITAERPSEDRSEPNRTVEDDDPDDAEEPDEIVTEIVPLPPQQKRIPASEVLDRNGVPQGRGGIARRLGGLGLDGMHTSDGLPVTEILYPN